MKLFGGMAIYTRCASAKRPELARKYVDIDVMGRSKQSGALKKMFVDLEYAPRTKFNAMYGDRRLVFNDPDHERRVDVFLDVFEMCHKFDMRDRLNQDGHTIPPADLLITKLQAGNEGAKSVQVRGERLVDPPVVRAQLGDVCSVDLVAVGFDDIMIDQYAG